MDWRAKLQTALLQGHPEEGERREERVSSVLCLIGKNRETGIDEIVLTKRTMTVDTHKGQVSFPGGRREPSDRDLLQTALRETEEEVAAKGEHVRILGRLDSVRTRGNVLIVPWVGQLDLPYPFQPSPAEVEHMLYLPLGRLVEEGLSEHSVAVEGFRLKSIGIWVGEELVWGATARMLQLLREALLR